MYLPMLVLITFISYNIIWIESCAPGCQKCDYRNRSDRSKSMKFMSDERKLNDVALMGTHLSEFPSNQDLSLADQLIHGVRVFHIPVEATSNKFALSHNTFFRNRTFSDVLNDIDRFFDDNPQEMAIILLDEVYPFAPNATESNCQILSNYTRWNTVKNWSLDDHIGLYRGKILFATMGNNSFSECVVNLKTHCQISSLLSRQSYGSPMVRRLYEMQPSQVSNSSNSQPSCVIKTCSYARRDKLSVRSRIRGLDPVNLKCKTSRDCIMANRFPNSHYNGLYILLADFPNQQLIDRINNSN